MGPSSRLLLLLPLLLLLRYSCCSHADAETILVSVPPEKSCSEEMTCIDAALDNATANLNLSLQPGLHVVKRFHNLTDHDYFRLAGAGKNRSDTVVFCEEKVGLAFLNTTTLAVENLVFQGCAFTGKEINNTFYYVNEKLMPTYVTADPMQVGIFLVLCTDVTFQNVAISNTKGIGLLSYNTMQLSFVGVEIYNNTPTNCTKDIGDIVNATGKLLFKNVGGGVVLIYENILNQTGQEKTAQVTIRDSIFRKNVDCSLTGYAEVYRSMLPLLGGLLFSSAGGGLSLLLTQTNFFVEACISDTTFIENDSRFGSGIHFAVFEGVTNTSVTVSNCTFSDNGFLFSMKYENFSSIHGGGGVAVFTDIQKSNDVQLEKAPRGSSNTFFFGDCTFSNNFGLVGGALRLYHSHFTTTKVKFTLKNCILQNNTGIVGAAITLLENTGTYADSHFNLQLNDSTITSNTIHRYEDFDVSNPTSLTGILSFGEVKVDLGGEIVVEGNEGTALTARETLITICSEANVTFVRNSGEFGGAMRLIAFSNLLLMNNSIISFLENTASIYGGALYIDVTAETIVASTGYSDCFMYFIVVNVFCQPNGSIIPCTNISTSGVKLIFKGNRAPIAGLIYGSTLQCSWARPLLSKNSHQTVFEILHEQYSDIFLFDSPPVNISQVSTSTKSLILLHPPLGGIPVIAPGEAINLTVIAKDHFGQRIPTVITSRSEDPTVYSYLDDTNFSFLKDNGDTISSLQLRNSEQENASNVRVSISDIDSPAQFQLDVFLRRCELGFQYSPNGSCQCSPGLLKNNVPCDPALGAWLVPDGKWLGPESENSTVLILLTCNEDFCIPGPKQVRPEANNFSQQCSVGYFRTGLGCGTCMDDYSQVFASNRCRKCTNFSLFLIILFAVMGILLVLALLLLPLRISEGYLNGVLLYSNIVTYFSSILIVKQNLGAYFTFFIVSILSLDLGIQLCFYDGMNALARTALQFVFPVYLFLLVAIFVLLGRFVKMPEWFGVSIPNTLVTLLILCYSKIAAVCFDILAPTLARVIDGETTTISIRWSIDPTVHYFQGWHAVLGVLSLLLIIIYLLPVPFLLLFPCLVFRVKCLLRLKPIYDAVWNPFKPSYRGWVGFRLLFRGLPFFFARLLPAPLSVLAVGLLLLLLLYVQLVLRPFNGSWDLRECSPDDWLRNEIDSFFIGNIIFIFLGSLYFHAIFNFEGRDIFVGIVVLVAYLVMAGIVIRAVVKVFRGYYQKHQARRIRTGIQEDIDSSEPVTADGDTEPLVTKTTTVVTFTELREPLLEDDNNANPAGYKPLA